MHKFILAITLSVLFAQQAFSQESLVVFSEGFETGKPTGFMGAKGGSGLKIDAAYTEKAAKGKKCIKLEADGSETWSGLFVQYSGDWREDGKSYADLSSYKYLTFYARSDKEYSVSVIGMGEGDEDSKKKKNFIVTDKWQHFVIELGDLRTDVNGLFVVVLEGEGVLFLDEIVYESEFFSYTSADVVYRERAVEKDPEAFYIFSDQMDNGVPNGYSGEKNGISLNFDPSCQYNPYLGSACIKITVDNSETWRALYIFYSGSWNAGVSAQTPLADLSEYDYLEFYARSDKKGTIIKEIGFGGEGGETDEENKNDVFLELRQQWKKYRIKIKNLNRSRVNTLLYIVPAEGTIYLDEVRFIKSKSEVQ